MWQPFGKVAAGRILHLRGVEPRLHAGRQLRGILRGLRDVEQIDLPVGADDAELPVAELDIGGGGFQQVRGDLLALVDDLQRGLVQRRAADGSAREPPVRPRGERSVSP